MAILQWPEKRVYNAGERAPVSGIYRVTHIGHRAPHEVLAIVDEDFPSCRNCGNEVLFEVLHRIGYVTHDLDLSGPANLTRLAA